MRNISKRTIIFALFISVIFFSYCRNNNGHSKEFQDPYITKSVRQMLDSIAINVSSEGPVAWLHYFENTPEFFMASDGQMNFQNNDSAKDLINNSIIKQINKIGLNWNNIRIDVLTGTYASIGSEFHEEITYTAGHKSSVNGYFTALAHRSSLGWQLRNLHWSYKSETPR
jgi:hypothetical protein